MVPFIEAAHGGDHHAGVGGGLFEVDGGPARQRPLDGGAGVLRPAGSQQGQRAVAVVGKLAWMRTQPPSPQRYAPVMGSGSSVTPLMRK